MWSIEQGDPLLAILAIFFGIAASGATIAVQCLVLWRMMHIQKNVDLIEKNTNSLMEARIEAENAVGRLAEREEQRADTEAKRET